MRGVVLVVLSVLAAACSTVSVDPTKLKIIQDVDPIDPVLISRICIEVNTDVRETFTEQLFDSVRDRGFKAPARQSSFGDECQHWLSYFATWTGFPEYLATAEIKVYDGRTEIGHLLYDARNSSSRVDRYGAAFAKIDPLLDALFTHVKLDRPAR